MRGSKTPHRGIDLLALIVLWSGSLLISDPTGDFPLNDDWSYGLTVKHLLETGDFRPVGWTSMPLITHVLWGWLFCLPFGFSFEALRLSTLAISLAGVLGCYLLAAETNGSRGFGVIVAVTLAFNPIYYALSHTFMTDVPFAAVMVLAVLFLARCLRRDSDFDLLIGTLLAFTATLNRQLGAAIPVAFALPFILKHGLTLRVFLRAIAPSLCCIGALLGYERWLASTGRLPALYNASRDTLTHALSDPSTWPFFGTNAFIALLYLGWFLSPVLAVVLWNRFGRSQMSGRSALTLLSMTGVFFVLLGVHVWLMGTQLMPLSGNTVNAAGIGPFTLRDTYILGAAHLEDLPTHFWAAITALGLLGGASLVGALAIWARETSSALRSGTVTSKHAVSMFLVLSAAIYVVPILVGGFFDRYLVPVVPLLAAGIGGFSLESRGADFPERTDGRWLVAFTVSLLLAFFAVTAVSSTGDYLTWNRTRWAVLHTLLDQGVEPQMIDGGFEFNGLYSYSPLYHARPDRSWWWVGEDTFVVAFGAVPGYSVVREQRYRRWLPPYAGSILLLKKSTAQNP